MDKEEKTVAEHLIYDGKVIKLYVDDVRAYNGELTKREIVRHPGGVAVLLIVDGRILLEKQYRYAYREEIWEIPAGKREPDENPPKAAIRELEEETGYLAEDIIDLGVIYPSVGYTNEQIHLYAVTSAHFTKTNMDRDECIESTFYTIPELMAMIEQGIIKDAKTICALYRYLQRKN